MRKGESWHVSFECPMEIKEGDINNKGEHEQVRITMGMKMRSVRWG
jgi:hypothetical protein